MTPISDTNVPELYLMLGRIQQSVDDMRVMLTKYDASHAGLDRRVGSLERSRVWAKAWLGGAIAVSSVALGAAWELYKMFKAVTP